MSMYTQIGQRHVNAASSGTGTVVTSIATAAPRGGIITRAGGPVTAVTLLPARVRQATKPPTGQGRSKNYDQFSEQTRAQSVDLGDWFFVGRLAAWRLGFASNKSATRHAARLRTYRFTLIRPFAAAIACARS